MLKLKLSVIVFRDKDRRILLQFRDSGAPSTPLGFSLFGGLAEGDETPEQAIVREVKEELEMDIDAADVVLLAEDPWEGRLGEKTVYFFEYSKPVDWRDFAVCEGGGAAFMTKEEVAAATAVDEFAKYFVGKYC